MKKTECSALEKLYSHEIESAIGGKTRLPFQSNAKIFDELEAGGFVRRATVQVGSGWSGCTVSGWELTISGNAAYCLLCDVSEPRPSRKVQPNEKGGSK